MPANEIYPTARPFLPPRITLPALRKSAAGCQGCDLYKIGTQTRAVKKAMQMSKV